MKSKEQEPSCLACGKPLARHDQLLMTCQKAQKLRRALSQLVVIIKARVAEPVDSVQFSLADAMRVLEDTV